MLKKTPYFILVLLYFVSFFSSVLFVSFLGYKLKADVDYNYYIFEYFCINALFIFPLSFFSIGNCKYITFPISPAFLKLIIFLGTSLSLISLFYFFKESIAVFNRGVTEIALSRIELTSQHETSLFKTIVGTTATFFSIQMLLLFYYATLYKNRVFLTILFVSTLSYPFFVMSVAGRDGFVFWVFNFMMLIIIFKPYILTDNLRYIKRLLFIVLIFFLVLFVLITLSRFLFGSHYTGSEDGVLYSIISYIGQSSINYSEYYSMQPLPEGLSKIFPLFFDSVSKNDNSALLYMNDIVPWVFKGFVGTLRNAVGLQGVFVLLFVYYVLLGLLYTRGKLSFSLFLFLIVFYTIFSQGVFYFRQYNNVGNLFIILCLFFCFVSKFMPSYRIYKQ